MKTLEQDIKQSKFTDQYEKAVVNLIYTAKVIDLKIKELLQAYDLTNPQYNILRILNGSDPKPLSPGAIKEVMLFKGSDLTRLLDRLYNKSLVDRIVCPSNRRMVEITITKEGKRVLKSIKPKLNKLFSPLKDSIKEKDVDKINHLLDLFRSNYQ